MRLIHPFRRIPAATALGMAAALALALPPAAAVASTAEPAVGSHCARIDKVKVLGAERLRASCLSDLTTAGTVASGHTVAADWDQLNVPGTANPSGVPGIQLDGYFPDNSTSNTYNGWNHDSQFVIRLPDKWNGKLVVAPPPGNRAQYSSDFVISDWVLAQGYAYASTDKGNVGLTFYQGQSRPGASIAEWNTRVTQLTIAAKDTLRRVYARTPQRTYLFGVSNGGYQVRWQLENRAWLYDGGLDWEGTLFRANGPNLLTYLPAGVKNFPAFAGGDEAAKRAAYQAILAAGFSPGSEYLWPIFYQYYWQAGVDGYAKAIDPAYQGSAADYDYFARPKSVRNVVRSFENTGRIGKPLISVQGTHDALLPISTSGDAYDKLVDATGRGALHRFYRITDGGHTDGTYPLFPNQQRPLLPCARAGFTLMTQWVEKRTAPPADHTYPRPTSGDLVNTCTL